MPKDSIISEGKTTNEAIENGLKILKVSKNMVNVRVIENEDKRSFFSILAPRVVKVELTLKDDKNSKTEEKINNTENKTNNSPIIWITIIIISVIALIGIVIWYLKRKDKK